jgi:site-specific DNA-methyltransferase (adenine-specific)
MYFEELKRVSKNQIIWGGNYFTEFLPPTKSWIFWHKKIANASTENFADGELAWASINKTVRYFKYDWVGLGGINNGRKSYHPTQKPVALYDWIFKNYAKEGDIILDTHLGSGSSRIAANKENLQFISCELDKEYFDAQNLRFEQFIAQTKLF